MNSLKERQLEALRGLKEGLPLPVRLIGEPWTDDHILCCKIGVLLADQPEVEIELWWIGWEGVAALKYADDSPRARADLAQHLASSIEGLEEELNEEDET